MAGLISANILRPELASSFATGYQQAEEQRNRLATQAQQREVTQFNLDRAKEDYAAMKQLQQQLAAAGKDPDMGKVADALIASGNADYMLKGMDLKRRLRDVTAFEQMAGRMFPGLMPAGAPATPTAPAAPATPAAGASAMPVQQPASLTVTPLDEGGAPAPTNALRPQVAAPVAQANALQAQVAPGAGGISGMSTEQLRQAEIMFSQSGDPRAKALTGIIQKEIENRSKVFTVRPGGVAIGPGGNVIYTAPTTPSEFERVLESSGLTPEEQKKAKQAYVAKQTTTPGPKPLTQAQQQRLQRDRAADKSIVKAVEESAALFEHDVDRLLGNKDKNIPVHRGLSGITGVSGMFPSAPESMFTSGDARAAQNLLDSLEGKVMALGRKLASQEGKLGNMAVQEWKFVRDSVAALDPTSKEFPIQLRSAVDQFNRLVINQKMRFDDTYGGGEESTAGPTGGSAGGSAGGAAAWEDAYKTYLGSKK